MYERLKRLYNSEPQKIDEKGLRTAVVEGLIIPEQFKEIAGRDYEQFILFHGRRFSEIGSADVTSWYTNTDQYTSWFNHSVAMG